MEPVSWVLAIIVGQRVGRIIDHYLDKNHIGNPPKTKAAH